MIWLNAGDDDTKLTLPDNKWVHQGEVVLSTNAQVPEGSAVHSGTRLMLQARSVMVFRQT